MTMVQSKDGLPDFQTIWGRSKDFEKPLLTNYVSNTFTLSVINKTVTIWFWAFFLVLQWFSCDKKESGHGLDLSLASGNCYVYGFKINSKI